MFTKGNKYGGKREGAGRKTIKQEVEEARELITQEALIALANNKVYKQLKDIEGFRYTKEMALPITLKGITEKKHIDGDLNIIIEKEIADRENVDTKASNNSQ